MENLMKVTMYTDGACSGNPGPGGYGLILQYTDKNGKIHEKTMSEGFSSTTNNRMELYAVIKGFELLIKPCEVDVYSDSQYVVKAFNEGWIADWVRMRFRRGKANEVKNADLWERLLKAMAPHKAHFIWVKGHADNEGNRRCDEMAVRAYRDLQKT